MKTFIRTLAFVTALVAALANVAHARSYTSGDTPLRPSWWHDPAMPGFAFTLSPSGNTLAGTLLTFDAEGEAIWYLVVGEGSGRRWTLPVTLHTASNRAGRVVGDFTFEVIDARNARASYTIDGKAGSATLVPLDLATGYSANDRSGHWMDPVELGHGYTVQSQGDYLSLVHYGYDDAGMPRWVYADNAGDPGRRALDAVYFRRDCATCTARALPAGTISAAFPLETEGTIALDLALPAPLSGGFVREPRAVALLTDLPSGRRTPESLARFTDDRTLEDYLRRSVTYAATGASFSCPIDFSSSPPPSNVSQTNTQEAGVDEADLVESDGRYLYSVKRATWSAGAPSSTLLRTHRLVPGTADLESTSDLVMFAVDDRTAVHGLYLVAASNGAPARLVAVLAEHRGFSCGGPSEPDVARIEVFSLADPANPVRIANAKVDGSLVTSRRIGRDVVLVTTYYPYVPGIEYAYGASTAALDAARTRNAQRVADVSLDSLVPKVSIDGGARAALVGAGKTWLPALPDRDYGVSLSTVTRFPIDDLADFDSTTVAVGSSIIYASTDSVYLTSSRYEAPPGPSLLPGESFTDIHRIALPNAEYRASGSVPGMLAGSDWSFAMSEHDDHLRVLSNAWTPSGPHHRLTVLREDAPTKKLVETGYIPNAARPQPIGKPGEFAYGVRFVGDRGYAVTFRQIDPLYVLDLADPADPKIAGELELPGFSTYLHPVDRNRLLGVGTEVVNRVQTVKLALFDVSNPAAPRLASERRIDHATSNAQHDHRAFTTLPVGDSLRIALPVRRTVQDGTPPYGSSVRYATFGYTLAGMTLADQGELVQAINVSPDDYRATPYGEQRSVFVGDALYTFLDGRWRGAPWSMLASPTPDR